MAPPPLTERSVFRVNLGILCTLITCLVGGTLYLSTLNSSVMELGNAMAEVKQSIDRNTEQQIADGKALAVLQTMMVSTDARLRALESGRPR